jgi:uncharacterized repeat protein (TIGR01451 family)
MNCYIRNCLLLAAIFTSVVGVAPAEPQTVQAQAGTWYVSNSGSDANACNTPAAPCATIQAAVDRAASGDTVRVAVGAYGGSGNEVVLLNKNVYLFGGWGPSFTQQVGKTILDGAGVRRGLTVNLGVTTWVDRVIIQNGHRASHFGGGGVYNGGNASLSNVIVRNNQVVEVNEWLAGGGIYNSGVLTLTSTSVQSNSASSFFGGGGIFNRNALVIQNSSLVGNESATAGAIYHWGGQLTVTNSTLSQNRGNVGGIVIGDGSVNIDNSTITGNSSYDPSSGAGGVYVYTGGTANVALRNSILASNTHASNPDCGGVLTSGGYNAIGNLQGCSIALSGGDLTNIDVKLGPLTGEPSYHPLLAQSPAINGGNPAGCNDLNGFPLSADQRGMPRVERCDIGAYEAGLLATHLVSGTFRPGGVVTYTITITNELRPRDMVGVNVTNTLPATTGYVANSFSATNGSGDIVGQIITWTGAVYSNTASTLTFAAQISDQAIGQHIANIAQISWSGITFSSTAIFDTFSRVHLPSLARNYCANFFDDFSNSFSGWPTGESDFVLAQYLNGEYRVQSKQPYLFLFRSPGCERDNYVVEADMRWDGAASSDIGLLFGVMPNFSQYYFATIDTNYQVYAIFRRNSNGTFSFVAPWSQTGSIHPGTQLNHLKVTRNGSQITLEINGIAVGAWYDGTITGPTRTGVAMAPYEDAPVADARFDNFRVTTIGTGTLALPGLAPDRAADPGQPLPAEFQLRLPEREWIVTAP